MRRQELAYSQLVRLSRWIEFDLKGMDIQPACVEKAERAQDATITRGAPKSRGAGIRDIRPRPLTVTKVKAVRRQNPCLRSPRFPDARSGLFWH